MGATVIQNKSFKLAIRIVNLYKFLCQNAQEFVLSKQLLRSGTSIGANIREAKRAQSPSDFGMKMTIALKEAEETLYWIELLIATGFLSEEMGKSIRDDCEEMVKLLVATTKKVYNKSDLRPPTSEL